MILNPDLKNFYYLIEMNSLIGYKKLINIILVFCVKLVW